MNLQPEIEARHVTDEAHDPRERFGLYRLCQCTTCEGKGRVTVWGEIGAEIAGIDGPGGRNFRRCPDCRGEGRIRQLVASCESPEAVGVALVTLAREGEWEECPFGLLDRMPECPACGGKGKREYPKDERQPVLISERCPECKGSGVKPTGTWLVLPWLPSPRNVSDAGKLLRSRRSS